MGRALAERFIDGDTEKMGIATTKNFVDGNAKKMGRVNAEQVHQNIEDGDGDLRAQC